MLVSTSELVSEVILFYWSYNELHWYAQSAKHEAMSAFITVLCLEDFAPDSFWGVRFWWFV